MQTPNLSLQMWRVMLARGVLSLILGVLVLVWPEPSTVAASIVFGVVLVVSGVAAMVLATTLTMSAGRRMVLLLGGALSLLLGVLAFRHFGQGSTVLLLAIWIGVVMLFDGVGEALTAIEEPVHRGRAWHIFLGIVTAIAGVVVLGWPLHSIFALMHVVGVWLVLVGLSQIVSAFGVRDVERKDNAASEGETRTVG